MSYLIAIVVLALVTATISDVFQGLEAYSFAKDTPLTLIDGPQLLGLLEQHGYKFRIDLAEAKRLL